MPEPFIPPSRRLALSSDPNGRAMTIFGEPIEFPNPLPARPITNLEALQASSAVRALYEPTDASTITKVGGGNPTATTDTIATVANIATATLGSFDLASLASGSAPQWQNGAILLDGVDDSLRETYSVAGPTNSTLVFLYRGTDIDGCFVSVGGSYAGLFVDGSGAVSTAAAGTPSYEIDGTVYAALTRAALHALVSDGDWHTVVIRNVNLSASSVAVFGRGPGGGPNTNANLVNLARLDPADADYADAMVLANAYAAEVIAELGP